MTGTDLHGLRLPRRVQDDVNFVKCGPQGAYRAEIQLNAFSLPALLAQVVLDVWDAAPGCEWLARQLFAKAWRLCSTGWIAVALKTILSSSEKTGVELAGCLPRNIDTLERLLTQEAVAAFNLIARRNLIQES